MKCCSTLAAVALSLSITSLARSAEQLPNLPDEKPAARFKVTPPSWPANPGDAEICVWKDDKIAPVSFTVDDNTAPDVPFWLQMGDKYGVKVTWFIISKNVGSGFGGTWDLWKDVVAKGHDVQSHTHTHLHTELPEWKDIDWEYAESKRLIEEKMPGHRIRFLAYPGGGNSKLNDRAIAGKYYAGARGVTGTLVSAAQIDYMGIRAITESSYNNPKAQWADCKRTLDPKDKVYRAWNVFIYHGVKDKDLIERPMFQYLADNKDQFWFSHFGETSMYGQQRDTATLAVTEKSDQKIVFTLEDKMEDKAFDYPLTIKVRLPGAWKEAAADQNGKPAEVKTIEHEGNRYAMVQAIPDRGPVTLTSK